jgi:hypothetical protein
VDEGSLTSRAVEATILSLADSGRIVRRSLSLSIFTTAKRPSWEVKNDSERFRRHRQPENPSSSFIRFKEFVPTCATEILRRRKRKDREKRLEAL